MESEQIVANKNSKLRNCLNQIKKDRILYIMLIPMVAYFIVFNYVPIYGMKLAFEDFSFLGRNTWAGLKYFKLLFGSDAFLTAFRNTIIISTMKMVFCSPIPIILALLINEIRSNKFRKYVQSVIFLPHFLSWVIIAGIWIALLSTTGAVNTILGFFQIPSVDFMTSGGSIRWVLVFSEMWRSAGWDSIIYLTAIMSISPSYYEAAKIDGSTALQNMYYITLPELIPTIITVYIMNLGAFMNAGFDQVYNMMNSSVMSKIDIIDTYVNRIGFLNGQYSVATAASMFKGVIGLVLIVTSHYTSKKISGKGLW